MENNAGKIAPKVVCTVCPHACALAEGRRGLCRARVARDGAVVCENYGRLTGLALDPIEKKPLYHFYPGSKILSVGSYGCNLRCFFCQNHGISQRGAEDGYAEATPGEVAQKALDARAQGNIGVAYTYNEPAVGWEFVRDTAREVRALGMKNVMVTNGCFCGEVLNALLPVVDAFNIDLKCFSRKGYQKLGGDLEAVKETLRRTAKAAHLEVTTLVVPHLSDGEEDMEAQARWLAALDPGIPLHLSRYFPRWQAQMPATSPEVLKRLGEVAKKHLKHVYLGNTGTL